MFSDPSNHSLGVVECTQGYEFHFHQVTMRMTVKMTMKMTIKMKILMRIRANPALHIPLPRGQKASMNVILPALVALQFCTENICHKMESALLHTKYAIRAKTN